MIIALQTAVERHAPVVGVSIGRRDDRSTWRIDFAANATEPQRLAALAALAAFDVLGEAKAAAQARVDTAAEAARLKYITTGAGQALTYQRKSTERMAYLSAVQMGAPVSTAAFPMLAASIGVEVPNTGVEAADLAAVAALIGAREAGFAVVGSQIERLRLTAKAAIAAAANEGQIAAAEAVVWP